MGESMRVHIMYNYTYIMSLEKQLYASLVEIVAAGEKTTTLLSAS